MESAGIAGATLAWWDAGCSVVPTRLDGSKAPEGQWKQFQHQRPTRDQVAAWYANGHRTGVGIVCGAVSGALELTELEGRALAGQEPELLARLAGSAAAAGISDLWQRIWSGYAELTPSGGIHLLYRLADGPVPGNTKLAKNAAGEVVAETRGEGGYVVVAPSNGRVHPTGRAWQTIAGNPATIPTITVAEREQLHNVFRTLDQTPPPAAPTPRPATPLRNPFAPRDGLSPGDDFEQRVAWAEILTPHGWTVAYDRDGETHWTRPGKREGSSATTGARDDRDRLYVFSTSTIFDAEVPYTKFGAYAVLNHGGDHSAAARALAGRGFGERRSDDDQAANEQAMRDILGEHYPPPPGPVPRAAAPGRRPDLDVTNAAVAAEWLRTEAGRGRLAGLFARSGQMVHTPREGEDGYLPVGEDQDDDGPAQIRLVTASTLASRIQYAYQCFKVNAEGDTRPGLFPTTAARVAVDVPDMLPNLRPLRGVVHSPVVRPDGSILSIPGYDRTTRLLHLPEPGLVVPPVPEHPTGQDVANAVALLDEMTADFRWVTDHDRANYYGLLLTPLLRAMIGPPYKLGAIGAPQPGSGKTLLANIARTIHGGVFRAEMPEDDAELRKAVTTILDVTTGPVVHFDNVSGTLRSSTLAGLLTSTRWDDRRLGSMEMISCVNDRLWIITGNNVALGGDLVRRALWVTIDPGVPHPELRTDFRIPDLETWVRERRGQLLHALLTMVRAWVVAGRPTERRGGDSYSRWIEAVDGILSFAGVPGRFADAESARQTVGSDDDDWSDFLRAVHKVFGDQVWTVKELLQQVDSGALITSGGIPLDALPAELAEKAARHSTGVAGIGRSLGRWLMYRDGRWAGAYAARSAGQDRTTVRMWRIVTMGSPDSPVSSAACDA